MAGILADIRHYAAVAGIRFVQHLPARTGFGEPHSDTAIDALPFDRPKEEAIKIPAIDHARPPRVVAVMLCVACGNVRCAT